jgi:signal peptidase I
MGRTGEWLKAFVLAVLLLVFTHFFLVRWVVVQSTSMFATLLPGDLVLVQRWPVWTGFSRGDIALFRDPLKDRTTMLQRPLLVKRIAGMPGDEVELRDGFLYVNGERMEGPGTATRAYLLRMRTGHSADSLLRTLGLPPSMVIPGRNFLEVPLNEELARRVEEYPGVVSATAMSPATGAPRHIFPYSPTYAWNGDDYGPLRVPARGDSVQITIYNLPLYDRIISRYEGHRITVTDDEELLLDGRPLNYYVFGQDHYFMLGDSRHHSADSRYWGFVPEDHLVGRASLVILSKGGDGLRSGRRFVGL